MIDSPAACQMNPDHQRRWHRRAPATPDDPLHLTLACDAGPRAAEAVRDPLGPPAMPAVFPCRGPERPGRARSGTGLVASPVSEDATAPQGRSVPGVTDSDIDFALIVFAHTGGAERAYGDVAGQASAQPWARDVAFVEHHRHDRMVVRGTFAGHYVDADDDEDFIGPRTAEGAVAGAAVGLLFGPLGLAVGFVGGGTAGGLAEEHSGPRLRSALFDELRAEVPEGDSAVVLMAAADEIDAMAAALEGHRGRLVRHRLTAEGAEMLRAAVADSPSAAPRPLGQPGPSALNG